MPSDSNRSLPELFSSLVGQISTLFRQEIRLARAEMGEKFRSLSGAVTPLVAGGAVLLGALIVLMFALAALVASFGIAAGWSLLIVGVLFLLLGYVLLRSGLNQLKAANLMPERVVEQLSRDAQVVKEQVQ
jgi:hypothetical protein